jgi:hypothetical protein
LDFSFFPTIPLPANSLQTWWLSMAPWTYITVLLSSCL